jgi:large subunit ribosomal protein L4
MVGQLANKRQGTASTKTRAEVAGGGAKPFRQKGTGRARAGSTRSPIWRGGGVTFGPKPRSYRKNTPHKMKVNSLISALSQKVRDRELLVIDIPSGMDKTGPISQYIDSLGVNKPALLVLDGCEENVLRAIKNIPRIDLMPSSLLNTLEIIRHSAILMTVESVRNIESIWGEDKNHNETE